MPENRLRAHRDAAGLTQADVAARINRAATDEGRGGGGVTANTVSRWERGAIIPGPLYRRLLAHLFGAAVDQLGLTVDRTEPETGRTPVEELLMGPTPAPTVVDPRVAHSQREWRTTRQALNEQRPALTRYATRVYDPHVELDDTGLIAAPGWLPDRPVDLADIELVHDPDAPSPELDGSEPESAHVRPCADLARPYPRYTQAIRDLDHPRLFDNRASWRLLDLKWAGGEGRMVFGPTTYFAAIDVCETVAHEMAYVHLGGNGKPTVAVPQMRSLPFRRLVGDPFDFERRPVMPAISTLTIRGGGDPSFILHRRDSRNVAIAGGMLQVIPSGTFQPSSVLPGAAAEDFSLWRNIQREFSEELLGNPEHDGDGQPLSYTSEPFASMDTARAAGRFRVSCLGVALDALTLMGEILTVAVIEPDVFDTMARDFVEVNDEGTVVGEWLPFTEQVVSSVLDSGRMAPAGAGCLRLAWRHREHLLGAAATASAV